MSLSKVCSRWGIEDFEIKKFKNGSKNERAKMACSLLKQSKNFVGIDRGDVRKEFGDPDGFYFSGIYPAYMIETARNDREDSWQIGFILDRHEKVSDIVVHKNCCSN